MRSLKILFSTLVIGLATFGFSSNAQACDGELYYLCDSWYPEDENGARPGLAGAIGAACPNGGTIDIEWVAC